MPTNILTASPTDPLLTPDDLEGIDETTRDTNERIRALEDLMQARIAASCVLRDARGDNRAARPPVSL
jgi:hypothetical protein